MSNLCAVFALIGSLHTNNCPLEIWHTHSITSRDAPAEIFQVGGCDLISIKCVVRLANEAMKPKHRFSLPQTCGIRSTRLYAGVNLSGDMHTAYVLPGTSASLSDGAKDFPMPVVKWRDDDCFMMSIPVPTFCASV